MFSDASTVVMLVYPHLLQGDGGSEAARERALNSAVAGGRLRGRPSCFPQVVEWRPGGKSLTARPLLFQSATRYRRMDRTPAHGPVCCARSSFDAAGFE